MRSLFNTPLETLLGNWWSGIEDANKKAFLAVFVVNVLAFGFEMTNLTLNHDDVIQIFIQDTILGHYLGRFGEGWLHYYAQSHYFMPFLQMTEGIILMSAYGVVVANFWGARKAIDIALIAAILCIFPYMAQIYQYNTAMATYSAAHLLAALAVVCSVRATVMYMVLSAILYVPAFSIYQAVAANAATIFIVWLLSKHLFADGETLLSRKMLRAMTAAIASVIAGGAVYLAAVSTMHLENDRIHSAEEAFELHGIFDPSHAIPAVWQGTKSFFLWPEAYFPDYLKALQLAIVVVAMLFCLWLPKRVSAKLVGGALLGLAAVTPRVLQLLHSKGHFHNLTLTAYALVIAGAVLVINRSQHTLARNVSIVCAAVLIAGYVIQCNWISTVGYFNTLAHMTTLTQVLARVRSIPDANWDGKTIAVVGTYDMSSGYPFKPATGVATSFMDANHMELLARLMRDGATFVAADQTMPKILQYAEAHRPWPDPGSVAVVDGIGVVVFSKPTAAP